MRIMKKPVAFILTVVLVMSLSPMTVMAKAGTEYTVSSVGELSDAIINSASGDTIILAANIDYPDEISISNKSITFNLNNFQLNVTNNSGNGLSVYNGGEVLLTGAGEFNVTSESPNGFGVNAGSGSRATVTNATAIGDGGHGVNASVNSSVTVIGNVSASGAGCFAAYAELGGNITIGGIAMASGDGCYGASVYDGLISVEDSIAVNGIGSKGIEADNGKITVGGDVTAEGDTCVGSVCFLSGGDVTVEGNITVSGSGVYAVYTNTDCTVTVGHDVSAEGVGRSCGVYAYGGTISVGGDVTAGNGNESIGAMADYGGVISVSGSIAAEGADSRGAYANDSGSSVTIENNVTATGDRCRGVFTDLSGKVTVNGNTSAFGNESYGAYVSQIGSDVKIAGSVLASGENCVGAYVGDGQITVDANVLVNGSLCTGIQVSSGDITVGGDVAATGDTCMGAECYSSGNSSRIEVEGTITVSGNGCFATSSNLTGSSIQVGGNVNASGENSRGAYAIDEGVVTISGSSTTYGNGSNSVYADGIYSMIQVGQDVVASGSGVNAVFASTDCAVTIGRDVSAFGSGRSLGACTYNGTITIGGDITAGNGDGSVGASADGSGVITVSGSAFAEGLNSRGAFASNSGSSITIENNVTAVGDSCYGAYAHSGAKVAVNGNITAASVTIIGKVYGARAEGGGIITVGGSAAAIGTESIGAYANNPVSQVAIGQSVSASGGTCRGVVADNGGSIVVNNNIMADGDTCYGVLTDNNATSIVTGNITVNSIISGFDSAGVMADHSGVATVSGIIKSNGTNSRGVSATNGGVITVDGNVYAFCPVIFNGFNIDSTEPTVNSNYFAYQATGSATTIRIRLPLSPTINSNPQDLARNENEQAVFTAAAIVSDGGTLSYQWEKLPAIAGSAWSAILGATGTTLTVSNVADVDDGSKYRCKAMNQKIGNYKSSAYSDAATLTVTPAAVMPTIQTHPASLAKTVGDTANFTVSATASDGGDLSYQWQISTTDGGIWSNISGATGAAFTIAAVATGDNGSQYRCVVTNSRNGKAKSVNSNAATLTVNSIPAIILVSISTPSAIVGLPNGSVKTAAAMGLPASVTMTTNSGNVSAAVNWDVASCSYNAASASAQTFDVSGTAILPSGVVNTNNVPLSVRISVSVLAKAADNSGGKSSSKSLSKASVVTVDGKTESVPVNIQNGGAFVSLNQDVVKIGMPEIKNIDQYVLELPASAFSSDVEKKRIEMTSKIGTILLPDDMLKGSGIAGTEPVRISIGEGDKTGLSTTLLEQIGNRPVIELRFSEGDRPKAWNNPDASVTVTIPYKHSAAELQDPEHIVVWYLDGTGNAVAVPSGRYDAETGTVTFSTTHFSRYAVAYATKTFEDLGTAAWAQKPIEILASKGIIEGISEKEYAPKTNITRGDFLCYLIRTLNIEADFKENFDDVGKDTYYYKEIGTAKKLGITSGTGKNQFHPDAEITRQDMMVLTVRTLTLLDKIKKESSNSSLGQFSDRDKIAAYAFDSVDSMVKEGLIVGSGSRLNPLENTTRAEAAVFLYRIYEKYSRQVK